MKMFAVTVIMFILIPVVHHHTPQVTHQVTPQVDPEEVELLARLVYAEAGGESLEGQWAVADVVVFISEALGYPVKRTILESGKFDGMHSTMFQIKAKDIPQTCLRAAKRALRGNHILPDGMLYFFNPNTATDIKWIEYLYKFRTVRIGNHVFCCRPRHIV